MTKQEYLNRPENEKMKKNIKGVSIVCYVCAAITLVAGLVIVGAQGGNAFFMLDVIFLIVMGILIQKFQNKVCAILLLIVGVLNMVIGGGGWLVMISGIYATILTFRLDKEWKEFTAVNPNGLIENPQPQQINPQPVVSAQPAKSNLVVDDIPKTMPLAQDFDANKTVALEQDENATVMMQENAKVMIKAIAGSLAGEVFAIEEGQVVRIGRGSDCDISFPQSTAGVSRSHCKLYLQGGTLVLEDVGSSFGSHVVGRGQLNANMPISLSSGSQFFLGKEENKFEVL